MKLPERSVEVKLKSMFDLRALGMELRDAYLNQREGEFFSLFDRLKQGQLKPPFNHAAIEGLRYAFRMTWAKNDFASVVQAGENLPEEVLRQEPLFAAYLFEAKEKLNIKETTASISSKIHPSVARLLVSSDNFDNSGLDPADWDEAKRIIKEEETKRTQKLIELAERYE